MRKQIRKGKTSWYWCLWSSRRGVRAFKAKVAILVFSPFRLKWVLPGLSGSLFIYLRFLCFMPHPPFFLFFSPKEIPLRISKWDADLCVTYTTPPHLPLHIFSKQWVFHFKKKQEGRLDGITACTFQAWGVVAFSEGGWKVSLSAPLLSPRGPRQALESLHSFLTGLDPHLRTRVASSNHHWKGRESWYPETCSRPCK